MKTVSPFLDIDGADRRLTIRWEGRELVVSSGNLAAALLAAGVAVFRTSPVSGAPRGPFCMMGACFDCLVEIDGIRRQACLVEAVEGMDVRMPRGISDGND